MTDFRKIPIHQNFIKIRPVGVELLHADEMTGGRGGMKKLIVAFRNSTNAPKTMNLTDIYDLLNRKQPSHKDSPYQSQQKRRAKYLCREGLEQHNTAQETNTDPAAKRPATPPRLNHTLCHAYDTQYLHIFHSSCTQRLKSDTVTECFWYSLEQMQPKAENKSENNGECQDYTNFTEI
jgi:hypothetical protein